MNLRDLIRQGLTRKKRAADAEAPTPRPQKAPLMVDTSDALLDTDRQQDDYSVRAKNSGHGKKTADKWNQ